MPDLLEKLAYDQKSERDIIDQPETAQGPDLLEKLVDGLVEIFLRGARLLPDSLDRYLRKSYQKNELILLTATS